MINNAVAGLVHTPPRVVALDAVEDELTDLMRDPTSDPAMPTLIPRVCTITMVIICAPGEEPESLEPLVSRVVLSNPGRIILVAPNPGEEQSDVETRVSAYHSNRAEGLRVVGDEIEVRASGERYKLVPSAVLGLRVTGVPFVLYWRGQPDFEDRIFAALVNESDVFMFDSAQFTARAEKVNRVIARLRQKYNLSSFGDINWQRIRAWREFIAQFFDDPGNLSYLERIAEFDIEYSVGFGGNQSQAVLLMGWLASTLNWTPVPGSYGRDGMSRRARFKQGDHEVAVRINVREQPDCMPGELSGVRIAAEGEPNAVFQIKRAVGGFVDIQDQKGTRLMERCATLHIPEDSMVIASELDSPNRNRNYHRAVELIEQLVNA